MVANAPVNEQILEKIKELIDMYVGRLKYIYTNGRGEEAPWPATFKDELEQLICDTMQCLPTLKDQVSEIPELGNLFQSLVLQEVIQFGLDEERLSAQSLLGPQAGIQQHLDVAERRQRLRKIWGAVLEIMANSSLQSCVVKALRGWQLPEDMDQRKVWLERVRSVVRRSHRFGPLVCLLNDRGSTGTIKVVSKLLEQDWATLSNLRGWFPEVLGPDAWALWWDALVRPVTRLGRIAELPSKSKAVLNALDDRLVPDVLSHSYHVPSCFPVGSPPHLVVEIVRKLRGEGRAPLDRGLGQVRYTISPLNASFYPVVSGTRQKVWLINVAEIDPKALYTASATSASLIVSLWHMVASGGLSGGP